MAEDGNRQIQADKAKRYVTYIRVSTERQGDSGLGLDAQRRTIASFLNRQCAQPQAPTEFIEIESGKSASNRPRLLEAIKRCRAQNATLLVAKLDRLSRDLWFITTIRKFGVKFICADNPEINELTLHILGAMAQHERELISERTRAALASAKARGVRLGNPKLAEVRNTDTAAAHAQIQKNSDRFAREMLTEIERLMHDGVTSLSAIARRLNSLGLESRRGSSWTPMAVKRVLDRHPTEDPLEDILSL